MTIQKYNIWYCNFYIRGKALLYINENICPDNILYKFKSDP